MRCAVGRGGIPTTGRRCYRCSSSSGSEMNGRPYHVCCGSSGQDVSSRDPVHVTRVYRSPPPATRLVEIKFKQKKIKRLVQPDLSLSAIRLDVNLKSDNLQFFLSFFLYLLFVPDASSAVIFNDVINHFRKIQCTHTLITPPPHTHTHIHHHHPQQTHTHTHTHTHTLSPTLAPCVCAHEL